MIRLSTEQVLHLHSQLVSATGGGDGVRDMGLLESAVEAPYQTFGGQPLYTNIQAKAARLGYGLIKNHPLVDGNKRIGAHAMLVLLRLNGVQLSYTQDELVNIIMQTAAGGKDDTDLFRWICEHQAT